MLQLSSKNATAEHIKSCGNIALMTHSDGRQVWGVLFVEEGSQMRDIWADTGTIDSYTAGVRGDWTMSR